MEALLRVSVAVTAAAGSSVYRKVAAANTPALPSRPDLVVCIVRGSMFLFVYDIIFYSFEGVVVDRITIL